MILRNLYRNFIFGALACLMFAACSDEDYMPGGSAAVRGLTFVAECGDMLPQFVDPQDVASRASDPKDEEEKRINTLHVFFFDNATGDLLHATDLGFDAYQYISSNILPVPDTDKAFEGALASGSIQIYALANLSGGTKFKTPYTPDGDMHGVSIEESPETDPHVYEINNRTDLLDWVYCPVLRSEEGTPVSRLPKAGMPMIGERVITAADYGTNKNVVIPMKALMARVDINVKLNPENESSTGLPRMTITEYGVKNMPKRIPFVARTGGTISNPDTTVQLVEKELTEKVNISIDKNSDVVRFHYYTYENVRQPDWTALRTDGSNAITVSGDSYTINYPDGVKSDDPAQTQRWKPTIARDSTASAMVLKAVYTTHQNLTYNAQFTVFMGENTYDNFEVHRNRQYVNNISIRGLDYVRNSDDGVYSFDGRVNVITDNPLYIAIVNERKVDAHASALPMDLWMLLREDGVNGPTGDYPWKSKVTVSVPDECDWIMMKKVPRRIMEGNGWKAGTGASVTSDDPNALAYFYTDMFTNPSYGLSKEVIVDGDADGSRSRVYLYINENVPKVWDEPGYGDRKTKINVKYERFDEAGNQLDLRERELEIEQRGLLKVNRWLNNGWGSSSEEMNSYMEYYEEYLEHNDPLDKHDMPGELYNGLEWGAKFRGQRVRDIVSGVDGCVVYNKNQAYAYTKGIISNYNNDYPINNVSLFNDESHIPISAFHYCYGKNTRASDGSVPDKSYGWYMPGIRELEAALVQYYNTFPTFREQFYWSAACGATIGLGSFRAEVTNEARATRVTLNGNNFTYTESTEGQPGSLSRGDGSNKEAHRIRAFYYPETH